ncbi:MAG TPA: sulfite exporter TauE/SafE family protein [Novosphingobium sp.]|nr:sulfite exporter TauE/SafE family protein [Novosphingobium sp.]
MDVYLPIATLSVNGLVIVALGALTGILSGLFGVGGGFLTTPLLIFYGVPPTVAAASAASQVTGASVSGVFAHARHGGVDVRMGTVMVAGGILGTGIGALLFRLLERLGQIDTVINILYVLLLGSIGSLMARESVQALLAERRGEPLPARRRRHHPLVASLPMRWRCSARPTANGSIRWRFYKSGLYISPLAPLLLGVGTGILTMLLGIGGGFVLVPAMLYILGMSGTVVVGTSLFQILFVTMASTMMHAMTTRAVDIVLAVLLLIGSVSGAQMGAQFAARARPVQLRLALAVVVLLVAGRLAWGLGVRPDEIYTVVPL